MMLSIGGFICYIFDYMTDPAKCNFFGESLELQLDLRSDGNFESRGAKISSRSWLRLSAPTPVQLPTCGLWRDTAQSFPCNANVLNR